MTTPQRYELVTIKDVFDKIPTDKIMLCMHEIAVGMLQAREFSDRLKSTVGTLGLSDSDVTVFPANMVWIDDDKGDITMRAVLNDTPLFTRTKNTKDEAPL